MFCKRNTIAQIVQHNQMDTKNRCRQHENTAEIKTAIKKISQILTHSSADFSSFEVITVKDEVRPTWKLYFKILDQTFNEDKKEKKRALRNHPPSQSINLHISKTNAEIKTLFYFIAVSGTTWENYLKLSLNINVKIKFSIQGKTYNAKDEKRWKSYLWTPQLKEISFTLPTCFESTRH